MQRLPTGQRQNTQRRTHLKEGPQEWNPGLPGEGRVVTLQEGEEVWSEEFAIWDARGSHPPRRDPVSKLKTLYEASGGGLSEELPPQVCAALQILMRKIFPGFWQKLLKRRGQVLEAIRCCKSHQQELTRTWQKSLPLWCQLLQGQLTTKTA